MGGAGGGVGFIMADGKFVVSLYSWQRGSNPTFYAYLPILLTPLPTPFSSFVQPPFPHLPVTSNLYPNCSFCCPVSLAE